MLEFVSLFAGSGGLDLGLEAAGWHCRYASDIDRHAVETLQRNKDARTRAFGKVCFSETFIERADVRELTGEAILARAGARRGEIPLLAGGPPCQSWSSAGHQLGFDDPRGRLWSDFVRLADQLDVRYLLFENVRGLLTARGSDGVPGSALATIRANLLERGFNTSVCLLNAADYGVPQRRVRLFIFGYRTGDEPPFPQPTHSVTSDKDGLRPWVSLGSALAEIGQLDPSEVLRPAGKMAIDLADIKPGSGVKSMGKVEATRPGGHWGYKQGAFVADLQVPARTVTAGSQQDWIRDPALGLRKLSPRECAAVQTYPSDYLWPAKMADQYRLIGNSVPPLLAKAMGECLADIVARSHNVRSSSTPMRLAPLPSHLEAAIAYTMREEKANGASRRAAPAKRRLKTAAG